MSKASDYLGIALVAPTSTLSNEVQFPLVGTWFFLDSFCCLCLADNVGQVLCTIPCHFHSWHFKWSRCLHNGNIIAAEFSCKQSVIFRVNPLGTTVDSRLGYDGLAVVLTGLTVELKGLRENPTLHKRLVYVDNGSNPFLSSKSGPLYCCCCLCWVMRVPPPPQ